ncbi:PD-(D/E)XK nuclease family protein [Odoribacter sp. OttesenSCG-928-J03]|nr:PD-(D/E)XK nuclease family protein [Odoribacter sp. OttesenSCG-928-J03]MDL2330421.1 PD-(D/E)XK nuclease family protein [Odoribacter sp. OttesenSCG-928-A06]
MSTFLQLLAKDLINKFDARFENVTIIFPNKRAGLFLASELSRLIDKPIWMPEIITISEFIEKHSGLKKVDDLILISKLYKSYVKASGSTERFDDFYFWGNMLLNDFDDIDKYLVDAKAIFSNLTALKEIDFHFSFLEEDQVETIKMFWKSFATEKFSKEQEEFLHIWDKLYPTYCLFREHLLKENLCYEGMGIRHFYEHIKEYQIENHIIFAGFNALSFSERQIFSFFQGKNKASFYWDYDIYYTSNEHHEAGKFIRENLKLFPNELGPEHFNNFRRNGKTIEYISVPSTIGQSKLIPSLLEKEIEKKQNSTAIILCDERMLIPVIHSIPDHIEKLNITMGYPAQNTSAAALIHLLGECKKYAKTDKGLHYYYYKPVIALLNHKLIKNACPEDIDKITRYIHQNNIVYVPGNTLMFNELTNAIFGSTDQNTPDYLLHILDKLSASFSEEDTSIHPIEKEFIFTLYTQIQSLKNTFTEEGIIPDDKLYIQIIQKVINSLAVPFSGEPLEELQLMGLLETRMLDFENLIILSANEGIIPKTNPVSSFIPYNLRLGFKLPTPEHQDALFAYYFYRMLQRGKNIKIMYSIGAKNMNSNEMSRYLFQIKYESGLNITERNFQNNISVQDSLPIEISKNEEVMSRLYALCCSPEKKLSPSALNIYIDCPLKFYFKYIAGIKEKEEIAEELDHRLLGNIFHECSESLYRLFGEESIAKEDIEKILKNNTLIDQHIHTAYTKCYSPQVASLLESGNNELILGIIRKYVKKMFEYDKRCTPFKILSMEKPYIAPIRVETADGMKDIYIGGTIDRVDKTEGGIRIIDYKTGADTTGFKNMASLFDPENKNRNKAAFQTLLYCLIYSDNNHNQSLIPGIYSIKLMFSRDYSHLLKQENNYIRNFELYREEFCEYLDLLLTDLFSVQNNFVQAKDESKCRYCSYNTICNK